jgi:hypothetical protein
VATGAVRGAAARVGVAGAGCHGGGALRAAFTFKFIHALLQRINAPHQLFDGGLLCEGR